MRREETIVIREADGSMIEAPAVVRRGRDGRPVGLCLPWGDAALTPAKGRPAGLFDVWTGDGGGPVDWQVQVAVR